MRLRYIKQDNISIDSRPFRFLRNANSKKHPYLHGQQNYEKRNKDKENESPFDNHEVHSKKDIRSIPQLETSKSN